MRWTSFLSACLILGISNAARPEPTSLLHGNLKADLRPDAANDPKKKPTDHRTPVAFEKEEEEKKKKKPTSHMTPVAFEKEEEKKEEKKEKAEEEDDRGECIPIPGAGPKTKPKGKSEECFDGGIGCHRSCKYLVEDDECGDCKEHDEHQPKPEEQIQEYQKQLGLVRIPKAMDSIGYVWGCQKENTVQCYDQDRKKHCCCNLGFIFEFSSRQCVADTEDKTNKEDPIPGSQLWSKWTKSKGPSGKCLTQPSKYCCHRSCTYELDHDKCGRCLSYDLAPTSIEHMIVNWQKQHRPYVIPTAICKPNNWAKFWKRGKCDLPHSSKCDDVSSMKDHCCCKQGLVFSFETRKCVTRASLKEEQDREYKAMQERDQALAAEENKEGPPPDPQAATYQQPPQQSPQQNQQSPQQNQNGGGGNGETTKMLVKTGLKASGMGSAATHSLALVVPILTLSMIRGLI